MVARARRMLALLTIAFATSGSAAFAHSAAPGVTLATRTLAGSNATLSHPQARGAAPLHSLPASGPVAPSQPLPVMPSQPLPATPSLPLPRKPEAVPTASPALPELSNPLRRRRIAMPLRAAPSGESAF